MPEIPSNIRDRYQILAHAGSGGMGQVYRARNRTTGEIVALKILGARGDADRLAREARLLSSLDHPGIVRCISVEPEEGVPQCLVMEWLSGHDLDDRIARGPLSVAEAVAIAKAVAEALAAAHRCEIIHRDLKPANVFLVDGLATRAKLIDFGLAKQRGDVLLTEERAMVGTPSFMAPEQIRGETLDARADVYALGALIFACLVGRPPFAGTHAIAVLAKAVAEPAPRLAELRLDVPPALDALVSHLLSKPRENRPRDAGEVLLALASLEDGAPEARRSPVAITTQEQRVACIVLCDATGTRAEATVVDRPSSSGVKCDSSSTGIGEAIEELGGTLHALSRDTALVTIRGSASPAEQAARAARCALAIAATRPHAPLVIATGRVIVSGSVQVGEVIDRATAALIERMTSLDTDADGAPAIDASCVFVDEATAELLDGRFVVRGEGPWLALVEERVEIAQGRMFLGRPAPCVGRASEIAALESALQECIAEPRSRATLLIAPPGVGKSRLLQEFCTRLRAGLVADVMVAGADPVRAGSSFALAAQLLRRHANIGSSDPDAVRARKLRAMIERTAPSSNIDRLEAFLGEIAGVFASTDAVPPELRAARADAAMMADVMREAWIDWLGAHTERRPLVIALEDLHWVDPASIRLIDAALDELSDRPLFVFGTARPEVTMSSPDLFRKRSLQQIHLGPLPGRAARAFAEATLGPDADPAVVDAVVERAAGHPFFLEELVRAVALGRGTEALPNSVLGMIEARLDELDAGARRVLRAASVFGGTFSVAGVLALLGSQANAKEVSTHLRGLKEREIIQRRARQSSDKEFVFRHALVRDAAYAMLTDKDKTLAHRLAAQWLEESGESDPAVLAEHFDLGASPAQALHHFRRAAKNALARSDLERAAHFAERALACGPDDEVRAGLFAVQSEVSYWKGELDLATERAKEATERLPPGCAAWFEAASAAIGALGQRGQNDEVASWLRRVAQAPSSEDARGAHVVALCRGFTQLAWAHHSDLGEVRSRLEEVAEPIDSLSPLEIGWVHRVRAEAAWLYDRNIDACLRAFEASTRAFDRAHAQRFACLTTMNHASLAGWSGDVQRALDLAREARKNAQKFGWTFLASYALAVTGMLRVFGGDHGGARELESALGVLAPSPRLSFICRVLLAWTSCETGDLDAAERYARDAVATRVVRELAPGGAAVLAVVLAARGDLDGALDSAQWAANEQSASRDLELFEGFPDAALAHVLEARKDLRAARIAGLEGRARLSAIARTISSEEHRARFWDAPMPGWRRRSSLVDSSY